MSTSLGLPPIPDTEDQLRAERYEVVCEDGHVRHPEPFRWLAEARTFAEWGHACTRDHTITVIPEELP